MINVFPHVTGEKEAREMHGYFTGPNGEGDKVKSAIALGKGEYVDRASCTADDIAEIKAQNVARLVSPRLNKLLDGYRLLTNAIKNNMVTMTTEQKDKLAAHIDLASDALKAELYNVKKGKERTEVVL